MWWVESENMLSILNAQDSPTEPILSRALTI